MKPVKHRDMLVQVILLIVTFGIYGLYWFYQTATELKYVTKDEEASPTLWTILLFVPFGCFYSYYSYAALYEKVASEKLNKWVIFILWLVFSPAVWFLVQKDLNQIAKKESQLSV